MSSQQNSNDNYHSDPEDCHCWPEDDDGKVEKQILDNLKSAIDKHAEVLKDLRKGHMEQHKKSVNTKKGLKKELAEKDAQLASKREPLNDRCKKTNEAIDQVVKDINAATSLPTEQKSLNNLLKTELKKANEKYESLAKEPATALYSECQQQKLQDLEDRVQSYRDSNGQLQKQLEDLKGKLQEVVPQVCNPKLVSVQVQNLPCPDCSEDSALAEMEMELHRKIANVKDTLMKYQSEQSLRENLPLHIVKNLETIIVGDKAQDDSGRKCIERKITTRHVVSYEEQEEE
jgi:chromosome segregation ATPase